MITGLENLSCRGRLRHYGELGFFILEKRSLWGHLIVVFQYVKRAYKRAAEGFLIRTCSDRTRGNGFKLKESRFLLDILKEFITVRAMKH